VPVFDWGEDEGTYFIVMELVDGTSLADMLRGFAPTYAIAFSTDRRSGRRGFGLRHIATAW